MNFTIVRRASFVRAIDEVRNALYEIHTNPQLKFRHLTGGATTCLCQQISNVSTSGKKVAILIYKNINKCTIKYLH